MSNIDSIINSSPDVSQFAKGYFEYISKLTAQLDTEAISAFVKELESARKDHNTVFFVGNGGSAATASHMANDLAFGSRVHQDPPFRVLSLTDNVAAMTAVANDNGYESLFIRQLKVHYRPGDKLVAISASGNSPNVVTAAEWVKEQGGKVIGLVGFDGGKLRDICDITICIETPKGEYGPVEDVHMMLDHLIYTWIWYRKRKGDI